MIPASILEKTLKDIFDGIVFNEEPAGLYDPLRYMISIGGKRIRPRLCLLAYSLFKDEFDSGVLNVATALEVFHSFTLIHDDIMDKAPIRRGLPTVYCKWNDNTAILSGDVMCIDAYRRMALAPSCCVAPVLALFSKTAAEVCEGQQFDMEFEDREFVSMDEYVNMIGLKTGVLIACAAREGALVAGAPVSDQQALYNYGYDLGLAFQIADDYLDTFGDAAVFGKAIGGDILCGKKTWLLTRAFEKATPEVHDELVRDLALPVDTPEQREIRINAVRDIYVSLGVDADAKAEIRRFSDKAIADLAPLGYKDGDSRLEALKAYADSLVGRRK